MSTAVSIYLQKIEHTKSIPFVLPTEWHDENGFTPLEKNTIKKAIQQSKNEKNTVLFKSMNEAIESL